jgi:hypothetical protein
MDKDYLALKRASASRPSGEWGDDYWCKMTRTELIIQVLKVAIGLAFGAYFVWWSLQVLDRLTPEDDVPTARSAAHHEGGSRAGRPAMAVDARLRAARGPHTDARL